MKPPNVSAIRSQRPLTDLRVACGHDPLSVCNVCLKPSADVEAWRECDERDKPIAGPGSLVFVADSHKACRRQIDKHARLYLHVTGDPGSFPNLCGDCTRREGLKCTHPDLKANGGPGLKVELGRTFPGVVCIKGAGYSGRAGLPPPRAMSCAGKERAC